VFRRIGRRRDTPSSAPCIECSCNRFDPRRRMPRTHLPSRSCPLPCNSRGWNRSQCSIVRSARRNHRSCPRSKSVRSGKDYSPRRTCRWRSSRRRRKRCRCSTALPLRRTCDR
jgi:hypothetical protein